MSQPSLKVLVFAQPMMNLREIAVENGEPNICSSTYAGYFAISPSEKPSGPLLGLIVMSH
jgi:hypothetical protein